MGGTAHVPLSPFEKLWQRGRGQKGTKGDKRGQKGTKGDKRGQRGTKGDKHITEIFVHNTIDR